MNTTQYREGPLFSPARHVPGDAKLALPAFQVPSDLKLSAWRRVLKELCGEGQVPQTTRVEVSAVSH